MDVGGFRRQGVGDWVDDLSGPSRFASVRGAPAQIDGESETADGQAVVIAQGRVLYSFAVHEDAVQAVKIEHLPNGVGKDKAAEPAADIRYWQAHIRFAVPAHHHIVPCQLHLRPARV